MKKLMMAWTVMILAIGAQALETSFAYQGVLLDDKGAALSQKTQTIAFRLYTEATGGTALWGRQAAVLLDNAGLFNVELSDSTGSGLALDNTKYTALSEALGNARTQSALFIGLTVLNSSGEIAPRQKVLLTPFSYYAKDVSEASGNFTVAGSVLAKNATVGGELNAGTLNVSSNAVVAKNLTVGGTLKATGTLVGNGTIPVRGIIMWSGSISEIPTGWALCNGQTVNGIPTPDMRDRFVVGAGRNYSVGSTGGEEKVTLTGDQLPSHSHGISFNTAGYVAAYNGSKEVVSAGSRNNGAYSPSTGDYGKGAAHENRPPYYAVAYIMRVE